MKLIATTIGLLALATSIPARADNPGHANEKTVPATRIFRITPVATLSNPWAMVFADPDHVLVTQKSGELVSVDTDGHVSAPIAGVPVVSYTGQNGLLDIALHPDFARNRLVYLSFAEPGARGTSGLAIGRGKYVNGMLKGFRVIFRDPEKFAAGLGHMAARMAFAEDGSLYVSSGERQSGSPAQSLTSVKGKVLRMTALGAPIARAPFGNTDPATSYLWTMGHRNPLGLAFDTSGRLWVHENGPQGGDELNLVVRGSNYGWPTVSNGTNYGDPAGFDTIPDHDTRPDFDAPEIWWNPSIAPSGLIVYSGRLFPDFAGDAFAGSLAGSALIRIALSSDTARQTARYAMDARIREVEQGPDGAIWVLEDGGNGRLLKLTPRRTTAAP